MEDALPSPEVLKHVWESKIVLCLEFETRVARTSPLIVGESGLPLRAWGGVPRRLPLSAALEVLLEAITLSVSDLCEGPFCVAPKADPELWLPP